MDMAAFIVHRGAVGSTVPTTSRHLVASEEMAAAQPSIGGYEGHGFSGKFVQDPFTNDPMTTDWEGFGYYYTDDDAATFGVWAFTEGKADELEYLDVGVFGWINSNVLMPESAGMPDGAPGATASYSGGAIGLMAGEEMNSVWTGEVELEARFSGTPATTTIGGAVRSPHIDDIMLVHTMMADQFHGTATMGSETGAWSGTFGSGGADIAGILGVGNVMGGYAAGLMRQ